MPPPPGASGRRLVLAMITLGVLLAAIAWTHNYLKARRDPPQTEPSHQSSP